MRTPSLTSFIALLHFLSVPVKALTSVADLVSAHDALTAANITPAVLSTFAPRGLLQLASAADGSNITLGQSVSNAAVAKQPSVAFVPADNGTLLITSASKMVLVMVDADISPNASSQLRHMLAANMQTTSLSSPTNSFPLTNTTSAVSPYLSPSPPAGGAAHRYIFALFVQPTSFSTSDNPFSPTITNDTSRVGFDVSSFAKEFGLGEAIAATFFEVQTPAVGTTSSVGVSGTAFRAATATGESAAAASTQGVPSSTVAAAGKVEVKMLVGLVMLLGVMSVW